MAKSQLPFSAVVRNYDRGHLVPEHSHTWPQLLYASSGVMGVETAAGSWVVPPQRAVWLPATYAHETWMLTDVRLNSLHLRPSAEWKNIECKAIAITPLLRELILAVESIDPNRALAKRDGLVVRLIWEELRVARSAVLPIPMPKESRLVRVCRLVLANPSLELSLDCLARNVGASSKTIARLFDRELGMSFRKWRELPQVAYAVAHMAEGVPIKVVASMLGYTPSAFSVMLRRTTGATPQRLQRALRSAENEACLSLGRLEKAAWVRPRPAARLRPAS